MNSKLYSDNWGAQEIAEAKQLIGPILIIGVSGFVGAKLFFSLSQLRSDVFGCSRNAKDSWRLKDAGWKNLDNIDITDYASLQTYIEKIKPKTIFNVSAYGADSGQRDIEQIHLINYFGTLNILRSLSTVPCEAFVQAGSSSEYGLNGSAPSEKDELLPNSDYAVSKIGASYLIKYYGTMHDIPTMHLRLYSIYGPWEDKKRLMPTLIMHNQKNIWPTLVNKSISHDFVYVDDCTNAFVKSALSLYRKQGLGESMNIATGVKTTMEDLAMTTKAIFNIKTEPEFGTMPDRKWDIKDWYGNAEQAARIINWQYKTALKDGLRLLTDWL